MMYHLVERQLHKFWTPLHYLMILKCSVHRHLISKKSEQAALTLDPESLSVLEVRVDVGSSDCLVW
jgi:hypothetical protein